LPAVFFFEERGDCRGGDFFAADIEKGACDIAHHFVEKASSFKLEAQAAVLGDEVKTCEGADGIFCGAAF